MVIKEVKIEIPQTIDGYIGSHIITLKDIWALIKLYIHSYSWYKKTGLLKCMAMKGENNNYTLYFSINNE